MRPRAGTPHSLGVTTLVHDDFLSMAPTADRLAVTAGGDRGSWDNKRIALIDWATGAVRYLTDERTAAHLPGVVSRWIADRLHGGPRGAGRAGSQRG